MSIKETIDRLEKAIQGASDQELGGTTEACALLAAAGEALGVLRILGTQEIRIVPPASIDVWPSSGCGFDTTCHDRVGDQ